MRRTCVFCGSYLANDAEHYGARCLPRPRRWFVLGRRYLFIARLLSGLAVGCGGQVEHEPEPAPCHVVRGFFGDPGCRLGRIEFSNCEPPEFAYTIRDHKCTLVRFDGPLP